MARAQGARAQMALGFETVYGTPPVSGFTKMPFASTSLGSEQPLLNSELLGYRAGVVAHRQTGRLDNMNWIISLLNGGIIQQFTAPLLEAHRLRLAAQNDSERLAADGQIASLDAARDIAMAEQVDRWSATRLGRLLIVVPFGIW